MNNISVNLENLTDKERDTLFSLIKKANNASERWKPEEGEEYYFLDDRGFVHKWNWFNCIDSALRYNIGNVFKTEEEAKLAFKKRFYATKLEDFARKHNGEFRGFKHYLAANKNADGSYYVEINSLYENIVAQNAGEYPMPSFSSIDVAREAIKEIGEENLLKYYFQVI